MPNESPAARPPRKQRILRQLSIQTIDHLARLLSSTPSELGKFAAAPDQAFRAGTFVDKKGKERRKAEPVGRLKPILKNLNNLLQRLDLPVAVHGGRTGCSNLTNAREHCQKDVVLAFDIKDFFPRISPQRVFDVFHHRCRCSPVVSEMLMKLTTFKDQLAQGSPPSTIIAALVAERLLRRIENLVTPRGGRVTIYVDDIAISGPADLAELKPKIIQIINQEGFIPHPQKSRVMGRDDEQVVTGLCVNDGPDISPEYLSKIRDEICALEHAAKCGEQPTLAILANLNARLDYVARLNLGAAKHFRKRLRRIAQQFSIAL